VKGSETGMDRNQKIAIASLIITIGFAFSIIYHYVSGMYLKLSYPFNSFLFRPDDLFMDFIWPYTVSNNPYRVARADFQNFPFLYRVASLFTVLQLKYALMLFITFFVYGFFMICRVQLKVTNCTLSYQNAFIFTFMTYPFLFALDRQNLEILVFFCLYCFVFLYRKNSYISSAMLGLAIALKAFPVILAVLLISDRRFKEILVAAGVALGATLISYLSYPGGLVSNIVSHVHNLSLYTKDYVIDMEGLPCGNSLFGAFKYIGIMLRPRWVITGMPAYLETYYGILIGILFILLTAYVIFWEKEFWKKVTLLICAMNLFPFISGDYKLLHLFIPLFLFINKGEHERTDQVILVLFALLLIPKDYLNLPVMPEASMTVLINPILMLILITFMIAGSLLNSFSSQKITWEPLLKQAPSIKGME
jgi:hypothetical protein